jgi:hypothetical protein
MSTMLAPHDLDDELAKTLADEEDSWQLATPAERDRYRRLATVAREELWRTAREEAQRLGRLR